MQRTFALCLAIISSTLATISVPAAQLYGLTTGNLLVRFDSATPGTIIQAVAVTGLQSGEVLQAIDFRPATSELFGLGSSNRLYVINTNTGATTAIGVASFGTLNGTAFGFDFNPTVDRIRVTADSDQDLRLNPNDGALTSADTPLNYAAGDVNSGANPNIVASAYLNNYPGAASTVLYGIDSSLDILVTQNPPNNGVLNTVGPLGFNTSTLCGFDISATGEAFAAMTAPGDFTPKLFRINLSTGQATLVGNIGGGVLIVGLTVVPTQMARFTSAQYSVSEAAGVATIGLTRFGGAQGTLIVNYGTAPGTATPGVDYQPVSGTITFNDGETAKSFDVPIIEDDIAELNESVLLTISGAVGGITNATSDIVSTQDLPVYLLTVSNQLLRFSTSPSVIQTNITITGLQAGEAIHGIDFRPATGQLFGLGGSNRLYTINVTNGVATAVGSPGAFTLSGTNFGFDFNPVVDRIRVTSDTGQNLRLNPNDGTLTFVDTVLNYAAGDPNFGANPNIVGSAYINNFAGAASTTLYDIDASLDILATQVPPNNGALNTVGSLGLDITNFAGFDITEADKAAYAVFKRNSSSVSEVFRINLATGAATLVGPVNSVALIRDIAIPEPQPVLHLEKVGTNAVVSWSAASAGYVLENTPSLIGPVWSTNLPSPAIVVDQKVVTTALTATNRYFRLRK